MRHAVIMAGGAGKRLWPLSRQNRPKQLLPLVDGKNLLTVAVERLGSVFETENILIVANAQYADQIAAALPHVPRANIIGEPEGRDTANAVALATQVLTGRDEQATMAVFTADHVIRPEACFADAVRTACEAAEANPDALLTFGVHPTWPHTGLGYIHAGARVADGIREVEAFREKPDHQTARRYVESGHHYWNSGMFVWTLPAIRNALEQFLPESLAALACVAEAERDRQDYTETLREVYPQLERISIDYAVMEKAPRVMMVELNCQWLDVGSWPALADVTEHDESDNVVLADNAMVVDGYRNVIVTEGDHLLAVIGMDDCIVVHAPDATLVCRKSDAQRIKDFVGQLGEKYGNKYL
ncbi:MAG: mannose-1-phosphate guanylyltransferase [Phycisphaerae bacterium]|nr:mannose-1-phosphate guanylyltransferase [Phycisphaerae bacterium]